MIYTALVLIVSLLDIAIKNIYMHDACNEMFKKQSTLVFILKLRLNIK